MTPSSYQLAIFDAIKHLSPNNNLVIKARAGSGKTSTIVEALKLIPSGKILFLAFNKSIAEELKTRVPLGVEVATMNGFGWRVCLQNLLARPKLEQWKTDETLKQYCQQGLYHKIRDIVRQTVSLMKAWEFQGSESKDYLNELMCKYGIEFPEKVNPDELLSIIGNTFRNCIHNENTLDFDDQIYYPVMRDMALPAYDKVFIDEAQDLNPVQITLVKRLAAKGSVVAVGDDKQAIYGFRGADPDALDNLITSLDAKVLPLSICYRCSKSVIKLAQNIVPDIDHCDTAPEGSVSTINKDEMYKQWKDRDFVLCRVTAPLVINCLRMIRDSCRATVRGRDIGQNLLDMITKIYNQTNENIFDGVRTYCNSQIEKLSKMPYKEVEIALMQDKCDTLIAILESCIPDSANPNEKLFEPTLKDVESKISTIFSDNGIGTVFSTVHKAKGLEAERVFILSPNLMPHPSAKLPWQKKQEGNLKYVAWTRAKIDLFLEKV